MQKYELIFDAGSSYTTWRGAVIPGLISLTSAFLAFVSWKWSRVGNPKHRNYTIMASIVSILAAALTVGILGYTHNRFTVIRDALSSGRFKSIEGTVSGLVAERRDGHPRERFTVGGVTFVYSSSDISSGFHWTVGKGGPIREGLRVRISDVDGIIARLEIVHPQ